jgi:hypothetical protein
MIGWIDSPGNIALARVVAHASSRLAQRYSSQFDLCKMGSIYIRHSEEINAGNAELLYTREEHGAAESSTYRLVDDNNLIMFPVVKHIVGVGPMICTYLTPMMVAKNLDGEDPKITLA